MKQLLIYLLSILILLTAWWLASFMVKAIASDFLANVFASPITVFKSIMENRRQLSTDFQASATRVIASLLIAMITAIPLGLIIGHERGADKLLSPIIYTTYPIPKIVFLPFLFILLGLGNISKIALITLVVFFQILISARDAAKNVPKDCMLSVLSTGAGKLQLYWHVIFPASLPAVLTSARISIGIAIAALYLSETFFARSNGLGAFIYDSYEIHYFPDVYAGIVAMGLLGLILYAGIDLIERILCKWKYV